MLSRLKFTIWKNIHTLPQSLIHLWQFLALRQLMKHAYSNTGLYHDLWQKRGLSPRDLRKLSDLQRFPIVNKKVFLQAPLEASIGMTKPQWHAWLHTSGTTGEPFHFISINNANTSSFCFLAYRFLYWEGFSLEEITQIPLVRMPIEAKGTDSTTRLSIPVHDFLNQRGKAIKKILDMKPKILESFPSVLVELAKEIATGGQSKRMRVRYAVSYGENLQTGQRHFLEKTFGCEVFDRYGTEEFWVVATECRFHNGFHLNVESFVLEIVDEAGQSVPHGKTGRIVLTDLRNYAMPFIRYDTGDRGRFLPGICPCGLAGERFLVEGREGEFLVFKGKKIHHLEFDKILKNFSGAVVQYQIVKNKESRVTLYIIRGPAMTESILMHIQKDLRALIDCDVNVAWVTTLGRTPRGKCQTLVTL